MRPKRSSRYSAAHRIVTNVPSTPKKPPTPMRTVEMNSSRQRMARTSLGDEVEVNSWTSGSKPCREKMREISSAARRSSSLHAGVMPMF